jgi:hypothetical protein
MLKRSIASVLIAILTLTGCTVKKVQKNAPPNIVLQPGKDTILGATTVQGKDVSFDPPGATLANATLHGYVNKAAYELPMDQVQRLWIQREGISTGRTIGLVAGIAVGTIVLVAGVIALTKQSCPFIYSWNGDHYVFDAEPYGGAIARGLEKDDYSELGELREQDGRYKLRMTNEVDETQMTNMTELWVVDHPSGTRVVPDIDGKLHTVSDARALISATDSGGHDLLPWLQSTDRLIWEPPSVPDANGALQGDITMTFPKPANAKQVKLVVNAATGLWGSYMIKKMVELRGRDTGKFYFAVNHSASARKALVAWETREEIYRLKVYVEEPTGWEVRGVLPGTGPFISKDRILPLDVSRVKGDQLRIRIHPPAGFWALNSFAADYSADQPISVQTVRPSKAVDMQGNDVLPALAVVDGKYLPMPNMGDTADISFAAPARKDGAKRTVILHSRGYYKLHTANTGAPDKKTLEAFQKEPGSAARFAAAQYATWRSAEHQAQLAEAFAGR